MNVTSKITVDLTRNTVGSLVNAVQGDGNTRSVEITLMSGGTPWTPPEGVEAAIAYRQPGGTKGLYNKLADGTPAISISGNVATVILATQMLAVSGTVQASLVFNDQQLNRLTTFPFSVSVASNPAAGAQKVEDYIRLQWLEDKLDEYVKKITEGLTPGGSGGAVSSVNGKTGAVELTAEDVHALPDTTKIPAVDATLTIEGQAADAKETGEALSQLKDDKLDKPADPPSGAGKVLRVLSVNDDGTFICEWADAPSCGGAVDDIYIDGNSIVSDGVATIPVAKNDSRAPAPGLVRVSVLNYGITFRNVDGFDGVLAVRPASDWSISNGRSEGAPLFMSQFGKTLKFAMCDGKDETWTDTERIAALLRMGCTVDDNGFVKWTAQEVAE